MPPVMQVKQKTPPKVGEDSNENTRVVNNATTPGMPDRDGPAKRPVKVSSPKTTEPAKKKADIKGMKKSLKGLI